MTVEHVHETQEAKLLRDLQALSPRIDQDMVDTIRTAREFLALPFGIISRISGQDYWILHAESEGDVLDSGTHFSLGETYCSITMEADDLVDIHHMRQSPHSGHPCFAAFQLESYIGVPLWVDGERFGTLNFSGPEPLQRKWDRADKSVVRMAARMIERCLERHQKEQERSVILERLDHAVRQLHEEQHRSHAFQRQLEREKVRLEQANANLEEFVYIASHDLQEPLRTISSHAKLLGSELGSDLSDDARAALGFVQDRAARMQGLVMGLLEFGRLGRDRHIETIELQGLALQVRDDLSDMIERTGARLELETLPSVVGDRSELQMVLQNLIQNALKFRAPGRTPVVTVSFAELAEARTWRFTVTDNGIGIAASQQDKIFGLFRRLNKRDDYDGIGIGLTHAKRAVENHGGKIGVESKVGTGTTIWFTLPRGKRA